MTGSPVAPSVTDDLEPCGGCGERGHVCLDNGYIITDCVNGYQWWVRMGPDGPQVDTRVDRWATWRPNVIYSVEVAP